MISIKDKGFCEQAKFAYFICTVDVFALKGPITYGQLSKQDIDYRRIPCAFSVGQRASSVPVDFRSRLFKAESDLNFQAKNPSFLSLVSLKGIVVRLHYMINVAANALYVYNQPNLITLTKFRVIARQIKDVAVNAAFFVPKEML